jgi:hypothetical protein
MAPVLSRSGCGKHLPINRALPKPHPNESKFIFIAETFPKNRV